MLAVWWGQPHGGQLDNTAGQRMNFLLASSTRGEFIPSVSSADSTPQQWGSAPSSGLCGPGQ